MEMSIDEAIKIVRRIDYPTNGVNSVYYTAIEKLVDATKKYQHLESILVDCKERGWDCISVNDLLEVLNNEH